VPGTKAFNQLGFTKIEEAKSDLLNVYREWK
jgi:hypothetical protein